jgi:hypothetical protein
VDWKISLSILLLLGLAQAEIVWEHPSQNFRCSPEDLKLSANFTFKNTGRQPVTITKITSSCGCTTANLEKKTYSAGESGTLTALFTFGGRRGAQTKIVTVLTDDKKSTPLSINCMITDEPVTLAPAFLFWRVGDSAAAKQVEVAVATNPAIQIVAVASSNPRITASLSPGKETGKYTISVSPTDTSQKETAEVFVQTNYPPEGPKAYTVQVRIK